MTNLGRKRSFDKTEALEKAMRVFWDNGFAGTSVADLTEALAINKPSLYAAFGNKEQLFNAALTHYVQQYGSYPFKQLTSSEDLSLAKRLENYLLAVVDNNTQEALPAGCLVVKSYCESGSNHLPDATASMLEDISNHVEKLLEEVLHNEQRKGHLPSSLDAKAVATYLLSLTYGISVMARRGKPATALQTIVSTALNGLAIH